MSSPVEIAQAIFSKSSSGPRSIQLGLEEADCEYIFEILINMFLEGMLIKGYIDQEIHLTSNNLIKMKEYFRSFFFDVDVTVREFSEEDELWKNRFCTIVPHVEDNLMKFKFLISREFQFPEEDKSLTNLNKYTAVYKDNNTLYSISFSYY